MRPAWLENSCMNKLHQKYRKEALVILSNENLGNVK